MRFMVLHCSIITIKRPLRAWYCFIILKSRLKYGETLTSFFLVSSRCMIKQANTQAAICCGKFRGRRFTQTRYNEQHEEMNVDGVNIMPRVTISAQMKKGHFF